MSAFTDRLYRTWAVQNGYSGPRSRVAWGMGGVPPMGTQNLPANPVPRVQSPAPVQVPVACPEKPVSVEKQVTLLPSLCTTADAVCTKLPFFDQEGKNLQ